MGEQRAEGNGARFRFGHASSRHVGGEAGPNLNLTAHMTNSSKDNLQSIFFVIAISK